MGKLVRPGVEVSLHMRRGQLATALTQGQDQLHEDCRRRPLLRGLVQRRTNIALVVGDQGIFSGDSFREGALISNPWIGFQERP